MALLNKEYKQKLGRIRLHYGKKAEILKAIEEAKEYINELNCIEYNREPDTDRVLEEMADVYVTMEHVKSIFQINNYELKECMKYKINRQIKRMERNEQ